eukprot:Pgem_evm1s237
MKTKTVEDKIKYNSLHHQVRTAIKQFWQKQWDGKCKELNAFWRQLKKINNNININNDDKTNASLILKTNTNNTTNDEQKITNIFKFAKHFKSSFNNTPEDNANYDSNNHQQKINGAQQQLFTKPENELHFKIATALEIKTMIKELNKKKNSAPGEDKITYEVLSHLPDSIIEHLVVIFNKPMHLSHIPHQWKHAIIKMFPKPDKTMLNEINYWPISLLNSLSKLLKKIINPRLLKHVQPLITIYQSAFVKDRQTRDALFRVI